MVLPDAARAVLQKPLVVRMAVTDPDGYPHVVPVWFGLDGDDIMIFGYRNTRKIAFLQANPKGSVQIGGDLGNDGYLLKGDYIVESDPEHLWAWKITRLYETEELAKQHMTEWSQQDLFLVRFVVNKVIKV
ncbi:MAG: pyridoxamine 5'-phosphate oxidase family protein [Anaerolineae bacterium]|nr:pyridoxamine 5'-phosphate oxidase family protein [Anaerolineae bacterium]